MAERTPAREDPIPGGRGDVKPTGSVWLQSFHNCGFPGGKASFLNKLDFSRGRGQAAWISGTPQPRDGQGLSGVALAEQWALEGAQDGNVRVKLKSVPNEYEAPRPQGTHGIPSGRKVSKPKRTHNNKNGMNAHDSVLRTDKH